MYTILIFIINYYVTTLLFLIEEYKTIFYKKKSCWEVFNNNIHDRLSAQEQEQNNKTWYLKPRLQNKVY